MSKVRHPAFRFASIDLIPDSLLKNDYNTREVNGIQVINAGVTPHLPIYCCQIHSMGIMNLAMCHSHPKQPEARTAYPCLRLSPLP